MRAPTTKLEPMALARTTVAGTRATSPSRPAPAGRADGPPADGVLVAQASHIRRCTFRRVTALPRRGRELPTYDVACLHPTYEAVAQPLGDLGDAYAACAACTLPGIFRPDED